jgi:hypothetical protein
MPTLARLLLAAACLLVAPLVVMADELPKDTNTITSLTAEQAKRLVAEFKGQVLILNGLTTLDADTARVLAQFKGRVGLPPAVEEMFSKNYPLTPRTALAFAARSNGQLRHITALDSPDSVAIAKALATREGPLALPNLKKISPRTLSALIEKEDIDIPAVETLELIPEPDGSPTDDFLIPARLQERQTREGAGQDR